MAGQLGEAVADIRDRHPDMGLGGWLLFGLWFLTAAAVGVVSDYFWKDKKLFLPGDVPMAIMFFYMTASAAVYFIFYLGAGS